MAELTNKDIGQNLQIERDWVHVSPKFQEDYGLKAIVAKDEGLKAFADVAKRNGLKPLYDPSGYMTLDDNLYTTIQDEYKEQFTNTANLIDQGTLAGSSYGMKAILSKLNNNVKADVVEFLPGDTSYRDLRFVRTTPELKTDVKKFVETRVNLSQQYSNRRQFSEDALNQTRADFREAGGALSIQLLQEMQKGPTEALSESDEVGVDTSRFEEFGTPEQAQWLASQLTDDEDLKIVSPDMPTAKFMLKAKPVLQEAGYKVSKTKVNGSPAAVIEQDVPVEKKSDEFNMDGMAEYLKTLGIQQ